MTLRANGDDTEKLAAAVHGLDRIFPSYEAFWKLHVAPATQRPTRPSEFRNTTAPEVILIVQRSYSVFCNLVDAHEALQHVLSGDFGPRHRHWHDVLTHAGNALQVFEGLQKAVEAVLKKLGRSASLFPDWSDKGGWKERREAIVNYRNQLTHGGRLQIFIDPDGVAHTLHRHEVASRAEIVWTATIAEFRDNPGRFMPLSDAAHETFVDTVKWLDDAYARILDRLNPLLESAPYQCLWGWDDGDSHTTAACGSGGSGSVPTPPVGWGSGMQPVPSLTDACATTCPPSTTRVERL